MRTLYSKIVETPLGCMKAVASEKALLMLDFTDGKYCRHHYTALMEGCDEIRNETNEILNLTQKEISDFFAGKLKNFSIPVEFFGSDFQKKVWAELLKIPYGQTITYKQQAEKMNNLLGIRAVANANSKNKISIIVPCHRVLGKNNALTGYAGGIDRKEKLLQLEQAGCFW